MRVERNIPRGERYELCRSVHAEANAIISAPRDKMIDATLYLVGKEVSTGDYVKNAVCCSMCKRMVINAGIARVIVRDDHITGEIDGPICFRDTKRDFLERWLKDEAVGETLAGESTFYSDSVNDVPLLETVRHPIAINPDPGLAQIAAQRGWPVEVWRCA